MDNKFLEKFGVILGGRCAGKTEHLKRVLFSMYNNNDLIDISQTVIYKKTIKKQKK